MVTSISMCLSLSVTSGARRVQDDLGQTRTVCTFCEKQPFYSAIPVCLALTRSVFHAYRMASLAISSRTFNPASQFTVRRKNPQRRKKSIAAYFVYFARRVRSSVRFTFTIIADTTGRYPGQKQAATIEQTRRPILLSDLSYQVPRRTSRKIEERGKRNRIQENTQAGQGGDV